jgi:hypothetical protein
MRGWLAVLLLAAGCPAKAPAPSPAPAQPAARRAPSSLPRVLKRTPAPASDEERLAVACLRRESLTALLELESSRGDCSGIGNYHYVFRVLQARGASARLGRAYAWCQIGGECPPRSKLFVAALRPAAAPARTRYCVPLPATDAEVTCLWPVADEAAGRRLLDLR